MGEEDCLFCKIASGEIPGKIVYDKHGVVAFEDIHPAAPHHVLFIPRRHVASMAELTRQDGEMLGNIFAAAAEYAHEQGLTDPEQGYRFVTNTGKNAGQSVFHLHFHLLGGRPFAWPPG
ncbi:MAG TPA: histidine triad nucleotide-binding protein [Ktedonobacteraceae bacterium]